MSWHLFDHFHHSPEYGPVFITFYLISLAVNLTGAIFAILTDAVSLAIIGGVAACVAAIPPSIIAYAGLQQTKIALLNAQLENAKQAKALAEVNGKTDVVINKATEIHTLTNSNLTKVSEALNVANMKIEGLQKLVSQLAESKNTSDKQFSKAAESQMSNQSPAVSSQDAINEIKNTVTDIQKEGAAVALDLALSHKRADNETDAAPGSAADAAAKLTPQEEILLDDNSSTLDELS